MKNNIGLKEYCSEKENDARHNFFETFKECPIPDDQVLSNLGLFFSSKNLSRLLFMHHIYQKIVDVQGVIFDFGTRWGQNMALFAAMRGIYEPFNRHRKIIGLDTFEGFPSICPEDGSSDLMKEGNVSVTENYEKYLGKVISSIEADNPLAHIKKFEICKGDACEELNKYFERHPETIVSLAYFDFDIYKPTKKCLELVKGRLVKGSLLGFDELNDPDSPGETLALMEAIGLNNIGLKRYRYASRVSYFVVE